ncbi:hypothetical protein M0R45_031256 [Rubus argutus]|uniref:Uncharacterized protein n=1 Tax=Rubus argutus TaxID=59490 RepID=A0AAW1WFK4_RUBAR
MIWKIGKKICLDGKSFFKMKIVRDNKVVHQMVVPEKWLDGQSFFKMKNLQILIISGDIYTGNHVDYLSNVLIETPSLGPLSITVSSI